ncbi:hypothetical protein RvY_04473 [Ramazzottius varieornatus]|uniref:Uncharacterized protein n=1 Tax=Ramazzottius varieornatus TaxID=947166 RepID=A0A1D1V1Q6_RAMVA|nr:hypothetical protein RvY_04473 [Ramazzottius varieornatus]
MLASTCLCSSGNCNTFAAPVRGADGVYAIPVTAPASNPSIPTNNAGSNTAADISADKSPSGGINSGGTDNVGGTNNADSMGSNIAEDLSVANRAGSGGTNGGVDPSASSTSGPPITVSR